MTQLSPRLLNRRFFLGSAAAGATAALAACTGNDSSSSGTTTTVTNASAAPGRPVTIGFSAPAADHGWMGAISKNATAQADQFPEVTFEATEGTNDVQQQISAVRTLIDRDVDALVILPFDGNALTEIATEAMSAGIPVVNLDRVFASPLAYRTWIGGDNYGMGANAGRYIADTLRSRNVSNPVIVEIAGIDSLELTQERSRGFREALEAQGLRVTARQAADFTAATGQEVTAQILQAEGQIDALWNHDDDQGIGVEAAIRQAGREEEFFMVGGAGSRRVMDQIKSDNAVIKATVLYSPSMASSAISLARLLAQGSGLGGLAEHEVPASITTYSAVVTRDNVDDYLAVGFE
ncbi:sugar ABC transporter substrate-binding protein [Parafrankia colletiae]|uniref:Sugar ABC transporter substrate-binding protein n=1 Tax=Parafrankia colletiae TaxID=573497 RepID=A0A1S1Q660_9ACTN|nr:substrate-binding domain-containing protein [Parafrankia colletiae]MCK9902980.1 substrate-binding domain-containing protein [Frankia sp. Cpl3]OHV29086.1 sugar ABC transporter substrate-binding protein [Parafrankia colletiae]